MNTDTYAAKYVPLGYRTLSRDEFNARRTARNLKTASEEAIQFAAPLMAALIDGPCWPVPVPASNGSLSANLALARAIAARVPGAHVKCAVGRAHPVEKCSWVGLLPSSGGRDSMPKKPLLGLGRQPLLPSLMAESTREARRTAASAQSLGKEKL